jgi:hypothetical protein
MKLEKIIINKADKQFNQIINGELLKNNACSNNISTSFNPKIKEVKKLMNQIKELKSKIEM